MKKLISLVLAAVMVLGMMSVAFAADAEYQITVENTNTKQTINGITYKAYKVFDLTLGAEDTTTDPATYGAYAYSIKNDHWAWSTLVADATTDASTKKITTQYGVVLTPSASDPTLYYVDGTNMTGDNARAFADALAGVGTATGVLPATADGSDEAENEKAVIDLQTAGYYAVYGEVQPKDPNGDPVETVVAALGLTTTDKKVTVNPKASVPELDKKIKGVYEAGSETAVGDAVKADGQAAVAKVGSTVEYQIDATTPDLTGYDDYTYIIGDSISAGLTYDQTSFALKINATIVNIAPVFADDNKSFTLTIPMDTLDDYTAGTAVVLTYKCSVNDSALTYDYENNTANLEYSRSPYDDETNHTPDKKTFVVDINLDIDKVAENASGKKLTGAKFKLFKGTERSSDVFYKWDETNKVVTWVAEANADVFEVEDGKLTQQVRGLDQGTYSFLEIEAPEGYNLLDKPVTVVLTPTATTSEGVVTEVSYSATYDGQNAAMTNGTVDVTTEQQAAGQPVATGTIVNNSGVKLPSTGGIGTTLFYIVGAALVLGAGILLVTKRKMAVK